jgi:pectate lyase-like protein
LSTERELGSGILRSFALLLILLCATFARAQYNPIPNFTGTLAGQQFRNALNNKLNGADTISPQLVHRNFAQLPSTVTNGQMYYVDDGATGTPCRGGGSGAIAMGVNGRWVCGSAMENRQSVLAYGAKGDCVTDDQPAIQAALDSIATGTNNATAGVYVPAPPNGSCYVLGKPAAITRRQTDFGGDGTSSVIAAGYLGPTLLVGTGQIHLVSSLLSGPGNALDLTSTSFIELTELLRGHLDGHPAFSIEYELNVPSHVATDNPVNATILQSTFTNPFQAELNLSLAPNFDGWPGAFRLAYDQTNQRFLMNATIKEGGTPTYVQTVSANSSAAAGNHAIGLYFDGSHLWNCVDGTASSPVAAAGTWSQSSYEMIALPSQGGSGISWFPDQGGGNYSFPGTIDNLRFSDVARAASGTCPTVPTTKFSYDSHTDLLLTFKSCADGSHYCIENATGGWAIWGQAKNSGLLWNIAQNEVWFPILGSNSIDVYPRTHVHDMQLGVTRDDRGIYAINAPWSTWNDLHTVGNGNGLNLWALDFENTVRDVENYDEICCAGVPAGYPGYDPMGVGMEFGFASNNVHLWNPKVDGWGWQVCFNFQGAQEPGFMAHGGHCLIGPKTALGFIFHEASGSWFEFLTDLETTATNWMGDILLNNPSDVGQVNFVGGNFGTYNGAPYIIQHGYNTQGGIGSLNGTPGITMTGSSFGVFNADQNAKAIIDFGGLSYTGMTGQIWQGAFVDPTHPLYKIADEPTPATGNYAKWDITGSPQGLSYTSAEYDGAITSCTASGGGPYTVTCSGPSNWVPSWWSAGHQFDIFIGGPGSCTNVLDYEGIQTLVSKTANSVTFSSASIGTQNPSPCGHTVLDYVTWGDWLRAPDPTTSLYETHFYDTAGSFSAQGLLGLSYALITGNVYLVKGLNSETLAKGPFEFSIPGASFDLQHSAATGQSFTITAPSSGYYAFSLSFAPANLIANANLTTTRTNTWPRTEDVLISPDITTIGNAYVPISDEPGSLHVVAEHGDDGPLSTRPTSYDCPSNGKVIVSEPTWGGPSKRVLLDFQACENTTGTAQVIPYMGPFAGVPTSYGTCPTGMDLTNPAQVSLPISESGTDSGQCVLEGD